MDIRVFCYSSTGRITGVEFVTQEMKGEGYRPATFEELLSARGLGLLDDQKIFKIDPETGDRRAEGIVALGSLFNREQRAGNHIFKGRVVVELQRDGKYVTPSLPLYGGYFLGVKCTAA